MVCRLLGRITSFKDEQPEKVDASIVVICSGMTTEARAVHEEKAEPPMVSILSGRVTSFKDVQPEKVDASIVVICSGMTTEARAEHEEKAELPILMSDEGNEISVILLQYSKAE